MDKSALRQRLTRALTYLTVIAALVGFTAACALIVSADSVFNTGGMATSFRVNEPAPETVLAPYNLRYESDVLTERARGSAAAQVQDVYRSDPSLVQKQREIAILILDYLNSVRNDSYATKAQRLEDIKAVRGINFGERNAELVLDLDAQDWQTVRLELPDVVEEMMRQDIRADQLSVIRATVRRVVSDFGYVGEPATLTTAIARDLIVSNSFKDEAATEGLRQTASTAVEPVIQDYKTSQRIISAGEIVTQEHMEALSKFGLLQPVDRGMQDFFGAVAAVLVCLGLVGSYGYRYHRETLQDPALIILLCVLFLAYLLGAQIFAPHTLDVPYLYPIGSMGLLLAGLVAPPVALALVGAMGFLMGLMANQSLSIMVMVVASSAVGILSFRRFERLNRYFLSGLVVGLAMAALSLMFLLFGAERPDTGFEVVLLFITGILNGVLCSATTLIGLFLIGTLFNMPTSLKLIEISQPSHPLLQRLLREAPGTYQHTLMLSNLVELAAERIGANPQLARAGALYHDIGKILQPHFFVENQDDYNPHDDFDPVTSARIIISHVTEGIKLAKKHRLPPIVVNFIPQHHGTTRVEYFYRKAIQETNGDESLVDEAVFTYPGPPPQSRETAILMLADASESAVRARRPTNAHEIEEVVTGIIESRLRIGQLDESGMTLTDLKDIREAFVSSLKGVFHPRIAYPPKPKPQPPTVAIPAPETGQTLNLSPNQTDRVRKADATVATPSEALSVVGPEPPLSAILDTQPRMPVAAPSAPTEIPQEDEIDEIVEVAVLTTDAEPADPTPNAAPIQEPPEDQERTDDDEGR